MNIKEKKQHNKVFNKTNAFRALLSAITISSFAKTATTISKGLDPSEVPIEISADTYHDIIRLNDNFPDSEIIYANDENSSGLINLIDTTYVDKSINRKNLALVKKISIDARNSNLDDLLLLPNLEELEILNCDSLTENDKKIINELSSLKRIELRLNVEYVKLSNDFNISWINDSIEVSLEDLRFSDNDLSDLYIYKLYENLDNNTKERVKLELFDDDRIKKLKKWNKEVEKIVESFNFNEETTDEEKLIKILSFVTDKIAYNPEVSARLRNNPSIMTYDEIDIMRKEYNDHLLEMVLDSKDDYGICCNYAALSSILAHYSNLFLPYICGMYSDQGHAWCNYLNDGDINIIDPTFLDSDEIFNIQKMNLDLIENHNANKKDEDLYKQYILEQIFTTPEEKDYNLYKPFDSYKNMGIDQLSNSKIEKSNIKVNEDISVYNQYLSKNIFRDSCLGWISILVLYANLVVNGIKKEKEMIKRK